MELNGLDGREAHPILFGLERARVGLVQEEETQLDHNHDTGKNQTNSTQIINEEDFVESLFIQPN